jgi:hypothetical protein
MTFLAFSRARTVTGWIVSLEQKNMVLVQGDLTVSGTRTNLDDDIGGLEEGLLDNGVTDAGVFEDVLAIVLVEAENVCAGRRLGGFAVVGPAGRIPFLLGRLGHCGGWLDVLGVWCSVCLR